jgi:hypothetical protein
MDSMETEYADAISMQSSQTAATIQTLADKYDSLHHAMMLLTERVSELAEIQTQAQNKRNRPLDTPSKFRLPPATNSPKKHSKALRHRCRAPNELIVQQHRLQMGPQETGPRRVAKCLRRFTHLLHQIFQEQQNTTQKKHKYQPKSH